MARETIVLPDGVKLTGRLVEHLGGCRVVVAYHGRRYAGPTARSVARRARS